MLYVTGMFGLGDSLYMRPVVRELAKQDTVQVETPWPFVFNDLDNVFCTPARTSLRTQAKNMRSADYTKRIEGRPSHKLHLRYKAAEIARGMSILESLERSVGVVLPDEVDMSIPRLQNAPRQNNMVFVRPVTLRREWLNSARAPDPTYIADVVRWVNTEGYTTFCIADVKPKEEWIVEPAPPTKFHILNGGLPSERMLQLAAGCDFLLGGVGFIVPLALATKTPLFCILGGNGAYNHPRVLTDPRVLSENIGWGVPDKFCLCTDDRHDCDKTISNLQEQYNHWRGWRDDRR